MEPKKSTNFHKRFVDFFACLRPPGGVLYWPEEDMREQGYGMLLTSTQADETAQHFYRKLGYKDCGSLMITVPAYAQPMELFLEKEL